MATGAQAIQIADRHPHLNRAQKNVVEDVLTSSDRIQGIQGYAGVGKTSTLTVLRSVVEAQGYDVQGFAPTSRAARQLREVGIEAGTLQGFLARTGYSETSTDRRQFYFVDESSLASTNQVRELLVRLGPDDRVLLIGDIRQHQGVEAGRPFEQLQQAGMRTAKLDEIVRQKDPGLKSAVELFVKGQASAAFDLLRQQDRVQEIPQREERIRAIAHSYAESLANTLIVSADNASRCEMNLAVREELKERGSLALNDHSFRVLVPRQDMTGADRAWANHYEVGDLVRYVRGSKGSGIEAGSYGTVAAINPNANLLSVEMQSGEFATYDPRRLTGVSVYRQVTQDFSVGDRVQFTAPDEQLGIANRDLAVIQSITPDGRIAARLEGGRQIEFSAVEHRHFDHGYAVTSHSAQGLTSERVLIHADTSVHPELLNSRFGYVSVSRATHEAVIFTNDAERLNEHVGAEITKTSALQISEPSYTIRGIGMSI